MNAAAAFGEINWLSVLIAGISTFVIGGLWYGPLFGKAWMKEFGFTQEQLKSRKPAVVFGVSFLLMLIAAVNLAMFIGPQADFSYGMTAGFFAGLGWVAMLLGVIYLFEMRSFKAWLINAGYCIVSLTTMGTIIGAW